MYPMRKYVINKAEEAQETGFFGGRYDPTQPKHHKLSNKWYVVLI